LGVKELGGLTGEFPENFQLFLVIWLKMPPKLLGSRKFKLGCEAFQALLPVLAVLAIYSLYGGLPAPEINESHYLTKARHFWHPEYAPGDLFLDSRDAHWVFFATFGWLTQSLSLPATAWLGRWLGWTVLAVGYFRFMKGFAGQKAVLPVAGALLWIAAQHWGHLSGEWTVGGCEAKVFAYGFCFVGLAEVVLGRWSRAWIWFGLGSAFHVLTGGWIVLASLVAYGTERVVLKRRSIEQSEKFKRQLIPLFVGGCASLFGFVPGLLLNRGVPAQTIDLGHVIYVYQRLSHHLSPLHFAVERWYSFAGLVLLTVSAVVVYFIQADRKPELRDNRNKLKRLLMLTIIMTFIAFVGLLIDVGLSGWATNWAASCLRFYWFRWNDVLWATLLTAVGIRLTAGLSPDGGPRIPLRTVVVFALLVLPGAGLLYQRWDLQRKDGTASAEKALIFQRVTGIEKQRICRDWQDACYWIRANTPTNALFLTPRFQQTFKWHAHRAEIVCWKDAPQDAVGLVEWQRRMLDVYPRDNSGFGIPMSDEHLREMFRRYRMGYVLMDRRIQSKPPLLPIVYSNKTYAVFEVPFDPPNEEASLQP
jgi:hypothetical protein